MMKGGVGHTMTAMLSALLLVACGDPEAKLAAAEPASGEHLKEFARKWNDTADPAKDLALLQRFCMNASGAACAPGTIGRLKDYGLADASTGSDLAYALIAKTADEKDGTVDQKSSDEAFVWACYRVMFGREPDPEGATHHLAGLSGKGEEARKALALAFLRAPEFASQK